MSVWCKKCGKTTFNEKICDHCQKSPKNEKDYNINDFEKETITINKNIILIGAVIIIAISMAYLAINKYRENKAIEEVSEIFLGTSDPEEIKAILKKQKKDMDEMPKKMIDSLNNIKIPTYDFGKQQREIKEREAQRKRIKERNNQIRLENSKRIKEINKQKLLEQMNN